MDLFGILNMGQQSLQTQRKGIEVAGNNMANVSTAGYSRQRLQIESTSTTSAEYGTEGTGAQAVAVQQLRDTLIDSQMVSESSVSGSLNAQQQALELVQSKVGQQIDRGTSNTDSTTSISGQNGLSDSLSSLFSTFQSLSSQPASSTARQTVLDQAQTVVDRFHQVASGLSDLKASLNKSISTDVDAANKLVADIASLNEQIAHAEAGPGGSANELRDTRQQKLEDLAKYVKIDSAENQDGTVDVSVSGASLISGVKVNDTLEAYDTGSGDMGVRTKTGATPLTLTGGSIQGNMQVRDGDLADLNSSIDNLAAKLVTEVNQIHSAGFSLTGTTGANFFSGSDAATIQLNTDLVSNPALIQASGDATATGNNQVALALAQLGTQPMASLNGDTFNQSFTRTVTVLGNALSSVNSNIENQTAVTKMLTQRRDSVSSVSLDEESTDMVKFQKAFQASARLISTVNEMLDTVIGLK